METAKLKKFAQEARRSLIEQVAFKLEFVLSDSSAARRENPDAVARLQSEITSLSKQQVIDHVAYTWFNRFCALRFMDANGYNKIAIVTSAQGQSQPEILAEAKMGHIDEESIDPKVKEQLVDLLNGKAPSKDPQSEAYRLLVVASCDNLNRSMPFLFDRIDNYTALLIPDNLLSDNSILTHTYKALTAEACKSVESIGWLYQFYISEKKDDVFTALKKGKKITPENIPAATQLFTPHWIVRYLVENSLGRLWMLNHPDSRLAEQMDYYIRPEEPETDFLQISSPEEIKICDPACGSGHMLTYAFDLLYAIYEEQGYQATDIPQLILTRNLYGIEIDERAGALAAFALTMKAREKDRRFFTRKRSNELQAGNNENQELTYNSSLVTQPNICVLENIEIDSEELSAYMDNVGRDLFTEALEDTLYQFEQADNFGSLIRPRVEDVSEVLELLHAAAVGEDLFLAGVHQKVLKALRQADYLSPKYHVVVANPPYMGSRNMNDELKQWGKKKYEEAKSDLFSMFMERSVESVASGGLIAMVTMQSWMFISSYQTFREQLLKEHGITTLTQIGFNSFPELNSKLALACAFVITKGRPDQVGAYITLNNASRSADKEQVFHNKLAQREIFAVPGYEFFRVPGCPIAFWAGKEVRDVFERSKTLSEVAEICQGMATTNNGMFLRHWFEVDIEKQMFDAKSEDEAEAAGKKWFPYNKGGDYRKWYGNNEHVVNFENRGKAICDYIDNTPGVKVGSNGRVINRDKYFKEGLTYGLVSLFFSTRRVYGGFVFDVGGSMIFPQVDIDKLQGFLTSRIANGLLGMLNPTLNYQVGDVERLPIDESVFEAIEGDWTSPIEISKRDWDRQETSWDFTRLALLTVASDSLESSFNRVGELWKSDVLELLQLEINNNSNFAQAYGLSDAIDCEVEVGDITLNCNPAFRYDADKSESELEAFLLADTMREFISYAVGCMLGRYSLDKPGLILANQGETADDYRHQIPEPTFAPDEDNVIPLLDGDWFTDDISERFKEFLKVTFGTEYFEQNLTFLENSLYPDNLAGKKRKTIRDYFLKEFYNHHIKLYKKRPIYWLFSSPKGTFNALIYMHRYRADTASVVLNNYLREFHTKLAAKVDQLQSVADMGDGSKAEKARALKEIINLKKQLTELEDYEREILFPLAQQQIEIDLDDGVVVNYNKFGKALKKVTGLTGK